MTKIEALIIVVSVIIFMGVWLASYIHLKRSYNDLSSALRDDTSPSDTDGRSAPMVPTRQGVASLPALEGPVTIASLDEVISWLNNDRGRTLHDN